MSQKGYLLPLNYDAAPALRASAFLDLPGFVWLDSCKPYNTQGRFDIISVCPIKRLVTRKDTTFIYANNKTQLSNDCPLDVLAEHLLPALQDTPAGIPFQGGALGYLAYELGYRLQGLMPKEKKAIAMPEMIMGIYDFAVVVDHQLAQATLFCIDENALKRAEALSIKRRWQHPRAFIKTKSPFQLTSAFISNTNKESYFNAIDKIKNHLKAGDCYQVNYTHCFSACFYGESFYAYLALRKQSKAPFAAFMRYEEGDILSVSPETFLYHEKGNVVAKPIKGTLPRGKTKKEDDALAKALLRSVKDRAENTMIVDLMRNDLSKVGKPFSITVPGLCQLMSYPAVHHLVSTVTATLKENETIFSLLKACFPGGSITGAPKHCVMQIIDALETQKRSVYCGSIGYISSNLTMEFNIAIRTLIACEKRLYCSAGGGIVLDSKKEDEYQESLDKIALIVNTLANMTQGEKASSVNAVEEIV